MSDIHQSTEGGPECRRWMVQVQHKYLPAGAGWSNLPSMYIDPFSDLAWAYRLHYELAFQTHLRRARFSDSVFR